MNIHIYYIFNCEIIYPLNKIWYLQSENNKTDCDVMFLLWHYAVCTCTKTFRFETNMFEKQSVTEY
jgi:hypothetical protein